MCLIFCADEHKVKGTELTANSFDTYDGCRPPPPHTNEYLADQGH